jgi:hypothetical protein
VLFRVLQEHLTTFLSTAADAHDGVGVPKFVEKELRAFLKCGVLAHGFALLRCADCKHDHVVGLSCKGRGFCSRCGGRRMTEQAAHLVDHVVPFVPMRQWVLTLPHRLRYRLGYDHGLCKQLLRIFVRALRDHYRMKTGEPLGEIGCNTFIHRFNSALALAPHFHTMIPDGVFVRDGQGGVRFVQAGETSNLDVDEVMARCAPLFNALLRRRGLQDDNHESDADVDPLALDAPALAALYAGSVTRRAALGPNAGKAILKVGADPNAPWVDIKRPRHSQQDGFDLHASHALPAEDRDGLERMLRYGARPAIAQQRLSLLADGRVSLELKRPYHDGTTHLVFEPLVFIERLAALVPKPNKNLVIYSGVLAPNAKLRSAVVAYGRPVPVAASNTNAVDVEAPPTDTATAPSDAAAVSKPKKPKSGRPNYRWPELMRRSFGIDVLQCKDCGGVMKLIDIVTHPRAIRGILKSLGLPTEPPFTQPSRAPPDDYLDSA